MNRTDLSKIGEFGIIDRINSKFKNKCNSSLIGIGDDAAVTKAEKKFKTSYDFVFDLDATSPLRKVSDIKNAFQYFIKSASSNLITATPARKNPYFNMIEHSGDRIKLVKSVQNAILPQSRQVARLVYDMNASIYIWKRASLFKNVKLINKNTVMYEMPEERSVDIDTMIDWYLVELLMQLNRKK